MVLSILTGLILGSEERTMRATKAMKTVSADFNIF